MPLGMEVDLGPGNFVLDDVPAPLPKKGTEVVELYGDSLV